jgi:hypothetical protein
MPHATTYSWWDREIEQVLRDMLGFGRRTGDITLWPHGPTPGIDRIGQLRCREAASANSSASTITRGAHDVAANIVTGRTPIVRKKSGSDLHRPQVFNVRHPQVNERSQKGLCFEVALKRLSNARNTKGKSIVVRIALSSRRPGPRIRVVEYHLTTCWQVGNIAERL